MASVGPEGGLHSRHPIAWVIAWFFSAVWLAGVALQFLPIERFVSPEVVTLDETEFVPNGGHAFVIPFESGVPDERGVNSGSPLRLFENDLELSSDSNHARIRSEGGGLFSHWGSSIYFSATDETDPRTNGRTYRVQLPIQIPAWSEWAGVLLLATGSLVLLLTSATGKLGIWGFASTPVALGVAISVVWPLGGAFKDDRNWNHALELIAGELQDGANQASLPAVSAAGFGPRTVRLFDAGKIVFRPVDNQATPIEPEIYPINPAECAVASGEAYALPANCAFSSAFSSVIRSTRLHEVELRLRVVEGHEVKIRIRIRETPETAHSRRFVEMILPVTPSPEWQTLRIQNPFSQTGVPDELVSSLDIEDPHRRSPYLRVEPGIITLSSSIAYFSNDTHGEGPVELHGELRPALWQSSPGEFRLDLPAGSPLRLKGAVAAIVPDANAEISYTILLALPNSKPRILLQERISEDSGWAPLAIDLPPLPSSARLILSSDRMTRGSALFWSALRVLDTSRAPRRVVLVLVDALRADAVGSYGSTAASTPALDRLGEQGARFTHAFSQSYWTRPSMSSLMTGQYVDATGIAETGDRLSRSFKTLAEKFANDGFYTLSVISNSNAGASAGLDQGFDELTLLLGGNQGSRNLLIGEALPRLAHLQDDDLFVYLHLMSVHGPYGPATMPPNFAPPTGEPVAFDPTLDQHWNTNPTAESRIALYHMSVEQTDAVIGEFFAELLPIWEATEGPRPILAVMSDHGELLGEYGQWSHHRFQLVPELVHVPLFISAPDWIAPGTVFDDVVENIDVGATLLELAGVGTREAESTAADPGRSLARRLADPSSQERAVASRHGWAIVSAAEPLTSSHFAIYTAEGSLHGLGGEFVGRRRAREFGKSTPVVETTPVDRWFRIAPRFEALWDSFRSSRYATFVSRQVDEVPSAFDPRSLRQLKQLGYIE